MRLHILLLTVALTGCASRPVAHEAFSLPACNSSTGTVGTDRWTSRVYMYATTEQPCSGGAQRLTVLVLMRGAPGWYDARSAFRQRLIADGVIDTLKLYALQARIAERHPFWDGSTEYLGDLAVDVHSTDRPRGLVSVAGAQLLLDGNNVVLVDRFDGVGGPPRFELLRLDNPVFDAWPTMESLAARSQRIRQFIEE